MQRHLGIFWIGVQTFMGLLQAGKGKSVSWTLPGLPDGARLESTCFSWERNAFGMLYSHPSFPLVYDGEPITWLGELIVEIANIEQSDPLDPLDDMLARANKLLTPEPAAYHALAKIDGEKVLNMIHGEWQDGADEPSIVPARS